ncbi:MAG TPA: YciI family protein [Actinocrinis sp.]|nr:YciI family protein [Actinocrinis sp.]
MPRYLSLIRFDEDDSPATDPDPEFGQRMGALFEEITKAGVMLDTAGLTTAADGARVLREGGKISVTDGPFTESKEIVGGYAIIQAKDKAEAVEWARRFLQVHNERYTMTAEVREIAE